MHAQVWSTAQKPKGIQMCKRWLSLVNMVWGCFGITSLQKVGKMLHLFWKECSKNILWTSVCLFVLDLRMHFVNGILQPAALLIAGQTAAWVLPRRLFKHVANSIFLWCLEINCIVFTRLWGDNALGYIFNNMWAICFSCRQLQHHRLWHLHPAMLLHRCLLMLARPWKALRFLQRIWGLCSLCSCFLRPTVRWLPPCLHLHFLAPLHLWCLLHFRYLPCFLAPLLTMTSMVALGLVFLRNGQVDFRRVRLGLQRPFPTSRWMQPWPVHHLWPIVGACCHQEIRSSSLMLTWWQACRAALQRLWIFVNLKMKDMLAILTLHNRLTNRPNLFLHFVFFGFV